MKVTERWKNGGKPTLSFELYPARSEKQAANLEKAIDRLAGLEPDFVSVTFGAGGSTREGSYQLVKKLAKDKGLDVMAYVVCYGLGPDELTSVLDAYRDLGIRNLLAARGDPPREMEDFQAHPKSLPHASDFIEFIRSRYDFCLGAAGYPEGHVEAESKEKDLEYLKLKVDQGADFVITNYCYDNRYFFDFVDRVRAAGIDVPILPGIMPVFSVKMMEMLANLCGATITEPLRKGLNELPEGVKGAVTEFGIEFATRQCAELLKAGVCGLHIYTMDRSKSSVGIVENLRKQGLL